MNIIIWIVLGILVVSIPIIITGIIILIIINNKQKPSSPPSSPPSPPPSPQSPKPSPPSSPPKPPKPDIKCSDVGEYGINQNCCTGLSYNASPAGASCAYNFNCIGKTPDTMLKQDQCLTHNSGKQCNKDKKCIVTSNGWGGFICVDKKYASGGIGINGKVDEFPTWTEKQQCYNSIKPFEFPGKSEGCTTDGDRPVYICCDAARDCCTPSVDKC